MTLKDFENFATGNLCNAHPEVKALDPTIRPLLKDTPIAGRARTVRIEPGQNAAIHRAVHNAAPGDLLVVDGGGSQRFGPFGDILAAACQAKGIVGAVFNCTVRDSTDINQLGFQLFSTGFHPEATAKEVPGDIDIPIRIGAIDIQPGDIVVGDNDGVVVFAADIAPDVLQRAKAVLRREDEIRDRLRAGETTLEIFNL